MSLAESRASRPDAPEGLASRMPWPSRESFERLARSPRAILPLGQGRNLTVYTDRVRARPALSPTLSMNIGLTAIGLGLWGALFPRHVKETLGIRAPDAVVQAVFGARELATGVTLASDPTRSEALWARVAGDVFDIAVLSALDRPGNPKRGASRAALAFVLTVTALDLVTAIRMSTVKRTCPAKEARS